MQSTIVRGFAQTLHSHHRQKWQSYQRIFRALGRLTTTKWCRMDQSRYWSYAKPTKCARSGFHSTATYPTICRFSKLTYFFLFDVYESEGDHCMAIVCVAGHYNTRFFLINRLPYALHISRRDGKQMRSVQTRLRTPIECIITETQQQRNSYKMCVGVMYLFFYFSGHQRECFYKPKNRCLSIWRRTWSRGDLHETHVITKVCILDRQREREREAHGKLSA